MSDIEPGLKVFYAPTPNGWKVTICLEEMGLPHTLLPVGLGQDLPEGFLESSPNGKIPAPIDREGPDGTPIALFESAQGASPLSSG